MADIRPVGSSKNRWTFWFQCEWLQLLGKFNWYTFTLIRFEVENESMLGNINWTFGLLGFVAGGSYTYDPTVADALHAEAQAWMDSLNNNTKD